MQNVIPDRNKKHEMMKNVNKQVEESRKAFDARLHTPEFRKIHGDDAHLDRLLRLVDVDETACLLDLGTGDGYVAFEMTKRWPNRSIFGVDVASESIARNKIIAEELELGNVKFHVYEGVKLPFPNEKFSGAICRYAFHHCPQPKITVSEISRILKADGIVVLSDPVPSPPDKGGFMDDFQWLQPDGHNCFHQEQSLVDMFDRAGFELLDTFESSITATRDSNARYEALLARTAKAIRAAYRIRIEGERIRFTLKVLNNQFKKRV